MPWTLSPSPLTLTERRGCSPLYAVQGEVNQQLAGKEPSLALGTGIDPRLANGSLSPPTAC